jgi:hypothetical protein
MVSRRSRSVRGLLVFTITGALLAGNPGAAGALPTWTVQKTQSPGGIARDLEGVAALSSTNAWAVGGYTDCGNAHEDHPLIEHWNGRAWKVVDEGHAAFQGQLTGITAIRRTTYGLWGGSGTTRRFPPCRCSSTGTGPLGRSSKAPH